MDESRTESAMEKLRRAGIEALRSHAVLLGAWRGLQESDVAEATENDVSILRELIVTRIYPVNAFGLLVRIDPDAAIEVLLSRYLGMGVDPDRKFGGFEFELETMLDDLREVCGTQKLAQLVKHARFSIELVDDLRVRRVFGEILRMAEQLVPDWIRSQRAATDDNYQP